MWVSESKVRERAEDGERVSLMRDVCGGDASNKR